MFAKYRPSQKRSPNKSLQKVRMLRSLEHSLSKSKINFCTQSTNSSISTIRSLIKMPKSTQIANQQENPQNIYLTPIPQKKSFNPNFFRSLSPDCNSKRTMKKISTRLSIRQLEELKTLQNSPISSQTRSVNPPNQSSTFSRREKSLMTTINSLRTEIQFLRQQNQQVHLKLIQLKSLQYYKLEKQKLAQMVEDLAFYKEKCETLENENQILKSAKAKQSSTKRLRFNCKVKG